MPTHFEEWHWENNEAAWHLQVRETMRRMPVGSSTCDLSKIAEQEEDDEEELRMLASLKRQQEEEEVGTCDSGLSASQVGAVTDRQAYLLYHYTLYVIDCTVILAAMLNNRYRMSIDL